MPMPPMAAMPTAPPARAVGTGTPLGDGFVDFGPAPDQDDLGLGMGWDAGPGFLLEESAAEKDARGDADAACNECCYSFFDALCGVPKGARDLRREAAGDGEVVLEDNETAAV
ncbi:hypothetical protein LX36DRAFT_581840 [Colletotrichum falcatum]|nr:hypothetical protein LX36DRAFT_581840 [Colletotrichum falcatum]